MKSSLAGMLIGGILPAVLFGFCGILQKISNKAGIGLGNYVLTLGIAVSLSGVALALVIPDRTLQPRAVTFAALTGICWAAGMTFLAIGTMKYGVPVSQLIPLTNIAALVGATLGLIVFAEWKEVSAAKVLAGTALIVLGCIVVTRA